MNPKKLELHKQTLRVLSRDDLHAAVGGCFTSPTTAQLPDSPHPSQPCIKIPPPFHTERGCPILH